MNPISITLESFLALVLITCLSCCFICYFRWSTGSRPACHHSSVQDKNQPHFWASAMVCTFVCGHVSNLCSLVALLYFTGYFNLLYAGKCSTVETTVYPSCMYWIFLVFPALVVLFKGSLVQSRDWCSSIQISSTELCSLWLVFTYESLFYSYIRFL